MPCPCRCTWAASTQHLEAPAAQTNGQFMELSACVNEATGTELPLRSLHVASSVHTATRGRPCIPSPGTLHIAFTSPNPCVRGTNKSDSLLAADSLPRAPKGRLHCMPPRPGHASDVAALDGVRAIPGSDITYLIQRTSGGALLRCHSAVCMVLKVQPGHSGPLILARTQQPI